MNLLQTVRSRRLDASQRLMRDMCSRNLNVRHLAHRFYRQCPKMDQQPKKGQEGGISDNHGIRFDFGVCFVLLPPNHAKSTLSCTASFKEMCVPQAAERSTCGSTKSRPQRPQLQKQPRRDQEVGMTRNRCIRFDFLTFCVY